jgi:hypothetical protein
LTTAVCLKCGALKIGARVRCSACSYEPATSDDQAAHLLTSDRFLSPTEIEEAQRKIKSGIRLNFNPAQIAEVAGKMRSVEKEKVALRQLIVFGSIALIAILLVVRFFVWLSAGI